MGTNEYSQPASKSSWDSQDFGDVNMVVKMAHFHKSSRPQWVNYHQAIIVTNAGLLLIGTLGAKCNFCKILSRYTIFFQENEFEIVVCRMAFYLNSV